MAMRNFVPIRAVLATLTAASSVSANTRFVNFFPDFAQDFERIRDEQCAAFWEIQQTKGHYTADGNCNELLSCILENTNEFIKANMASGTIALGLAPTILSVLGSTTGETALLSRRRPLLAILLAFGSVAVNPLPSFVYEDPIEALERRKGILATGHVTDAPTWQISLIVLGEYILTLAAIANVGTALYFAGMWTSSTISCDTVYFPILWALITPGLHIMGMIALRLRTKVEVDGNRGPSLGWSPGDLQTWIWQQAKHEFSPCAKHEKLKLEFKKETYIYVLVSWWASVCTATHLLWGTIALSSLVFLGYVDSIKIIGRLMASVIVCRAVLVFELAGMRNAIIKLPADANEQRRGLFERLDTEEEASIPLHNVDISAPVNARLGSRKQVQFTLGRTL